MRAAPTAFRSGVQPGFSRLFAYAAVAGLGLCADIAVYAGLVASDTLSPGVANAVAALAGITLAFALSVRRIFGDRGRFLAGKFLVWLAWQSVLVSAASYAVGWLAGPMACGAALAKIIVTPLTFLANFLAMTVITRRSAEAA